MPEQVKNVNEFVPQFKYLFTVVERCSPVLFRKEFRDKLPVAIYNDVYDRLDVVSANWKKMSDNPDESLKTDIRLAGLSSPQVDFKMESFSYSLLAFDTTGLKVHLVDALEKGGFILKSIVGLFPEIGSSLQEFLDFILKEFKKRFEE